MLQFITLGPWPPNRNLNAATCIGKATDSLGNIWKHIYLVPRNRSALWLSIIVRYTNTLIYLLTYLLKRQKSFWIFSATNWFFPEALKVSRRKRIWLLLCSSVVCSFCAIAAASYSSLWCPAVWQTVTFNTVRCPCNGLVREVSP